MRQSYGTPVTSGIADASVSLYPWRVRDGAEGKEMAAATSGIVTALTYTIRRIAGAAVIGLPDRNGLNANGVSVTDTDHIQHVVPPVDNELEVEGAAEWRSVEYLATLSSGHQMRHLSIYYLRPPE